MARLRISMVTVIEGALYEVWGEDGKLVVFDQFVRVVCDGTVYDHVHMFYGSVETPDGFHVPNYNAKQDAQNLAARVHDAQFINTEHWHCIGNLTEIMKTADERLAESWSDVSDHYENY